jgi:hypothetical protein
MEVEFVRLAVTAWGRLGIPGEWFFYNKLREQKAKSMPDNFTARLFLRKTDTCLGIYKVNLSMHSLNRT